MREQPDGPEPERRLRFPAIRARGLELSKRNQRDSLQKEQRAQALMNGAPARAPASSSVILAATAGVAAVAVMFTEMASPLAAQPGSQNA
jgi:hypothetical protein